MRYPFIVVIALLLEVVRSPVGFAVATELPIVAPVDIYTRPLPEMPVWRDPAVTTDIFTLHLYTQIHATLFRIDEKSQVRPYLARDFAVSRDQLTYDIDLHPWHFHDGRAVGADDVKACLENAIRSRAQNFQSLGRIEGFQPFVDKKAKQIKGIEVVSPLKIKLKLVAPDPTLVGKLTDLSYSIWDLRNNNVRNGLGPYRVVTIIPDKVVLRLVPQRAPAVVEMKTPRQVNFVRRSADDAFAQFKGGPMDDLFNYPITRAQIEQLKEVAHVQSSWFPRTYFLAINARTLADRAARKMLLDGVNTAQLVTTCFPEQKSTSSLVPPGYWGHQELATSPESLAAKPAGKTPLRIAIVESIGNEICLKDYLQKKLGPVKVEIATLSSVVRRWPRNELDGVVAYLEALRAIHYFGAFMPDADFSYGDPQDKAIPELFRRFDQAASPGEKNVLAQKLSTAILDAQTFRPLFHPEVFLVYKKRFKKLNESFQATALLPIGLFEREK